MNQSLPLATPSAKLANTGKIALAGASRIRASAAGRVQQRGDCGDVNGDWWRI